MRGAAPLLALTWAGIAFLADMRPLAPEQNPAPTHLEVSTLDSQRETCMEGAHEDSSPCANLPTSWLVTEFSRDRQVENCGFDSIQLQTSTAGSVGPRTSSVLRRVARWVRTGGGVPYTHTPPPTPHPPSFKILPLSRSPHHLLSPSASSSLTEHSCTNCLGSRAQPSSPSYLTNPAAPVLRRTQI